MFKHKLYFSWMLLSVLLVAGCSNPESNPIGPALSSAKDITSFSFASPAGTGVITGTDINVKVAYVSDYSHTGKTLVADFLTTGVKVEVNGVEQESGVTVNDFTVPVVYTVTAENGSTKEYTIIATDDPYNLNIRDTGPAGGLIFDVQFPAAAMGAGWKYLEAAPEDLVIESRETWQWGARGHGIGTTTDGYQGKHDTTLINAFLETISCGGVSYYAYNWADITEGTAAFTDGNDTYNLHWQNDGSSAAVLAASYSYGGYDDWFLPSQAELEFMCSRLRSKIYDGSPSGQDNPEYGDNRVGNFATSGFYWSSTEGTSNSSEARAMDFLDGFQNARAKTSQGRIRPVRRF